MSPSCQQPDLLSALDEFTSSIYQNLDLEELEQEYIRLIQMLIPSPVSALYLFSPNKLKPLRITGQGLDMDFINFYEEDGREVDPLHLWIRKHSAPNLSQKLLGLKGWCHHPIYRIVGTMKIDYAMQSPIVSGDEIIGTMNFGRSKRDGPFLQKELSVVSILSKFLSVAITNAIGVGDTRRSKAQLRTALKNIRQGVVITDSGGAVFYRNQKAIEMSREESGTDQHSSTIKGPYKMVDKAASSDVTGFSSRQRQESQCCPIPGTSMQRILMLIDEAPVPDFSPLLGVLTNREIDVLRLVEQGQQNPMIADNLCLSVNTIKRHLDNIYNKLSVNSRTELISKVYRLLNFIH